MIKDGNRTPLRMPEIAMEYACQANAAFDEFRQAEEECKVGARILKNGGSIVKFTEATDKCNEAWNEHNEAVDAAAALLESAGISTLR